jgi:hypothetical protein
MVASRVPVQLFGGCGAAKTEVSDWRPGVRNASKDDDVVLGNNAQAAVACAGRGHATPILCASKSKRCRPGYRPS